MKELKIYASVRKSRQITKQEVALAGGKLLKELKKTYGSDGYKKLVYLNQKSIECGGESKQIVAKQLSLKEKFRKNMSKIGACINSAMASGNNMKKGTGMQMKGIRSFALDSWDAGLKGQANSSLSDALSMARNQTHGRLMPFQVQPSPQRQSGGC